MARRRVFNWVFFCDLLFNLVVGLTCLFFLALLLINPITENKKIDSKAEFIITMDWTKKNNGDVDLWVMDPTGAKTGYTQKENGVVSLERDDTGLGSDTHFDGDGNIIYNPENSEIITVRANIKGEWIVNVHYYASRIIPEDHSTGWEDPPYTDSLHVPVTVTVKVIKLNPKYLEIVSKTILLTYNKEERMMARFVVNEFGDVIRQIDTPVRFVPRTDVSDGRAP